MLTQGLFIWQDTPRQLTNAVSLQSRDVRLGWFQRFLLDLVVVPRLESHIFGLHLNALIAPRSLDEVKHLAPILLEDAAGATFKEWKKCRSYLLFR